MTDIVRTIWAGIKAAWMMWLILAIVAVSTAVEIALWWCFFHGLVWVCWIILGALILSIFYALGKATQCD